MTAKEVANKYFGANVFPAEVTEKFLIHKKSTNPTQAKIDIAAYRGFGYTVKSKTYSSFVSYIAVKSKAEVDKFNFNNR